MNLRTYILALHAALFSLLLAVSPAGSGSISLLGAGSSGAVVYVGPGDVTGWSTAYAAYSLRCFTAAYSGNVARIRNVGTPATQTLLTCSGGVVSATVNSLATTCATSCELYIWYDQSGNARDLTTVSGGSFPTFVASSFVGQYSATFVAPSLISGAAVATALAQPITVAAATKFTGTGEVFTDGTFGFQALFSAFANNRAQATGVVRVDYTGVDSTTESLVSVLNGASSSMKVNGGSIVTASTTPGANGIASTNKLTIGATDAGASGFNGNIYEVLIYSGAKNSTEQAAIVANQRTIGTGW